MTVEVYSAEWFRRPLIDRGALLRELMIGAPGPGATAPEFEEHADRVLALLQLTEGVHMTREEAALAAEALRHVALHHPEGVAHDWGIRRQDLAEKCEAAS